MASAINVNVPPPDSPVVSANLRTNFATAAAEITGAQNAITSLQSTVNSLQTTVADEQTKITALQIKTTVSGDGTLAANGMLTITAVRGIVFSDTPPSVGQVPTWSGSAYVPATPSGGGGGGGGTLTSITAGVGLTGGVITSAGTIALASPVALANGGTGVAAASPAAALSALGGVASANPALTGTPTAPTAAAGTNNTQLATTAFVMQAVAAGGGGGGNYVPLSGGEMSGHLRINTSGMAAPPTSAPQVLQLASTGDTAVTIDSAGATGVPRLTIRRAMGAFSSLAPLAAEQQLGFVEYRGWNGSDWSSGGNIQMISANAWNTGSAPARMEFQTTPAGSVLPTLRMWLGGAGGLVVGFPGGGDRGAGSINAESMYCVGNFNTGGTIYIQGLPVVLGANNSAGPGFRTMTIANI